MTSQGTRRESDLLDRAETLSGAFQSLVAERPGATALILQGRKDEESGVTAKELWDRASSVRQGLANQGHRPDQVVVLVLPTGLELVSAYLGVLLAGGVPALLSTPSRRVADPEVFARRVAHVQRHSHPHSVVGESEVLATLADRLPARGGSMLLDVESLSGFTDPLDPAPRTSEDIATLQYSSGTTGEPKGVLVSHRAVLNNLRSMRAAFELTATDVSVNWIPLFHDMGLFGAFLLPLLSGCRTVLIPTEEFMRDPSLWLRAIDRHRGTFSWGPNMAYSLCAKRLGDRAIEGLDLSSWRLALNGSEPVMASTLEAFNARFAPYGFAPEAMSPAWGLAETTVLGTVKPVGEAARCEVLDRELLAREDLARPSRSDGVSCVSIGRPIPGIALEIRDDRGKVLRDRRVGQIWMRSNACFDSYHGADDDEETLIDGWLRTGDRGYMVDGHLFFLARDKDLIIIGGEKYVPDDIEAMVNRVPGVREGCVVAFGVVDQTRGTERLAVVAETRETAATALESLRRRIRSEITRATGLGLGALVLTAPDGVQKTTSGKLSRSRTRDRYAAELEEEVRLGPA